jgi:predicted CoA-binding protein
VGLSEDETRPSFRVARVLRNSGYDVVPVNPNAPGAYPSLSAAAAEHAIEVVDVFRRSEHVSALVDEAIAIGAKAIWLQLGVRDEAAEARAHEAGLLVVVDRCPAIELPRLRAA